MLQLAICELCEYLRGEVRTISALSLHVLTEHDYIKNAVLTSRLGDEHHNVLTGMELTTEGRNLPDIKRALVLAEVMKREDDAATEARAIMRRRRRND